jgi:hypothetical protein
VCVCDVLGFVDFVMLLFGIVLIFSVVLECSDLNEFYYVKCEWKINNKLVCPRL